MEKRPTIFHSRITTMKKIVRTILTTLATSLVLSPLVTYAITTTLGANQFDCVPQRFRNQNPPYSATYQLTLPSGRTVNHLDAPGLGSDTMIQTGTVDGCTYYGQPLTERIFNMPYCYTSRFIETKIKKQI